MKNEERNFILYTVFPLLLIGILPFLFFYPSLILFVVGTLSIRWYIQGPMYQGVARDISGQTVVITGGNCGIGKETARNLAMRGAKVIILCRDVEKGAIAAKELAKDTGKTIEVRHVDLSSLDSVRRCAAQLKEEEPKINILINNAGVLATTRQMTKDGFEMHLGTNHYGHFLLTLLLLDNIKAAGPSRIINVSALAHKFTCMNWDDLHFKDNFGSGVTAYSQSKLANILFTKSLAKKLDSKVVTCYSLHPGVIRTEIGRNFDKKFGVILAKIIHGMQKLFFKDAKLGAQTTIACAVDLKLSNESGKYYSDCKEKMPSLNARNEEDAERLWNISLKAVGLEGITV